jgi:hypothetical protein
MFLKFCGCILLLAAAQIGHAQSVRVCNVELRPAIQPYYRQALRSFKKPACSVTSTGRADGYLGAILRFEGRQPIIECDTEASCANEHIIAHEVLHLWLYTRGFEPHQRYNFPLCPGMPPTKETWTEISNLVDYFQHRVIIPIETKVGFDTADEMQAAIEATQQNASIARQQQRPALYPLDGAQFLLNLRLRAPSLVPQYESWLRSQHFDEVISLADTVEEIADRIRPVTSQTAQTALDEIFQRACSGKIDYSRQL